MRTPTVPQHIHPGWFELVKCIGRHTLTRRKFLSAAAGGAGIVFWRGLPLATSRAQTGGNVRVLGLPDQANWPSSNKIKHVVILCQENRSFDHYLGAFASMFGNGNAIAEGFDPAYLTYSNGAGIEYHPYHLTHYCDADPDHSWEASHAKRNSGLMNGWVTAEGGQQIAIGYFEPSDHIYHVELARAFTLADHYFCARRAQCSKEPWTTPRFYSSSSTPFPRRLIRSRCQPSTPGAEGSPIPASGL